MFMALLFNFNIYIFNIYVEIIFNALLQQVDIKLETMEHEVFKDCTPGIK